MKKRICAAALSLSLCASMSLSAAALNVEQARELLGEHYIAPLPPAAQQAETLDGLFSALNDPYTLYYTAEEYEEFLTSVNGDHVVGIGVSIQSAFDRGFELLSILPGSPALEAGLKAGDVITAVDGVTLTAQDNIAGLLSGEEGTEVTVTVRRANGITADFTMIRRTVQIPIVTYEKQGDIGYIDCSSFGNSTADDVSFALFSMDSRICVWVMDLRNNPGGVADSAALTATQFLGGQPMVYYRDGQDNYYLTSTSPNFKDLTDKPVIILTSESSASAAELFSGAIRDYGAGIAIGQRTFGKGIAQIVLDQSSHPELFEGDALKITAYQFFSPKGLANHLIGVLPSLMIDQDHVPAVTELLSSPAPHQAQGWLKLTLAGHNFYLDPQVCHNDPDTLNILLESLPPAAQLYRGKDVEKWIAITPAEAAQKFSLNYQPRTFSDVENSPNRTAIDTLACYGLIAGDGTGRFLPENTLTRAELSAMLCAAFQLPAGEGRSFSDVAPEAWYAGAVSAMTARGFLAGTDQGTFEPNRPVTNQELYTVLSAIAAWGCMKGHEVSQTSVTAPQWLEFYHYPEWAQSHARNLDELGVTVDKENPTAPATRGQTAQALYELMDAMGMFWY